ncbi:HNH endonuclease [Christiangramia crocea]|uniref:HNH endonuclease n=1 Tax=Christiangramia crocea TaxID=2904124 RepID=A0A9X1UVN3_9FLAO|nr:HNH endonuclease [Gramella crocea]MCG9971165.1 HNH endonuclease [Gramella crocea]
MKKCLWCKKNETIVSFEKKAHTIPKSLGGQSYNNNVCDSCNEYFGNRNNHNGQYSIEEALKEAFNISRKRFLKENPKRKVGRFKSKFFEVKSKNGKYSLTIKPSFRFSAQFQKELCRAFKRGLYKMFLEELNRQKDIGYEKKFDFIREFARYNLDDLPIIYFRRSFGAFLMFDREAETPVLYFDRMKYLCSDDKFIEIEFLGHVFGFPISYVDEKEFEEYLKKSVKAKEGFFHDFVMLTKLTDIDLALSVLND